VFGEFDAFLRDNEAASEVVIDSHPEVCFCGFLGEQLNPSKKINQGIGGRIRELDGHNHKSSLAFGEICRELDDESLIINVDNVIYDFGLAVVASYPEGELRFLSHNAEFHAFGGAASNLQVFV
jgi:predicted RNase H-like nuclease